MMYSRGGIAEYNYSSFKLLIEYWYGVDRHTYIEIHILYCKLALRSQ